MPEAHLDWRREASAEYVEKRGRLLDEKEGLAESVTRAQQRMKAIDEEVENLDRGAKAFGLSLAAAWPKGPDAIAEPPPVEGGGELIKDIILDLLRDAYPQSLKARQIKERLEAKIGRSVHEKTPGMTLYRLSKERKVRRAGRDWYFAPPELFEEDDLIG